MSRFVTLCERARTVYPPEAFADQILAAIGEGSGTLRGWQSTTLPARIADLIQDFANRAAAMPQTLAQKFRRILDLLVDLEDRRSAALQLDEAFREIRLHAYGSGDPQIGRD